MGGHFDEFGKSMGRGFDSILKVVANFAKSIIDAITYPFRYAFEVIKRDFQNLVNFLSGNNTPTIRVSAQTKAPRMHAKGYTTPLLFKKPTILPTVAGLQGFGELGGDGEIVYGRQNLMNDMEEVLNGTTDEISVITSGNEGTRDINIILELDKQVFGRAVYRMNKEETQRVGVQLAGGIA